MALCLAIGGCTKLSTSTAPVESHATAGVVRYGLANDLNTLNAITTTLAAEQNVIAAMFDGLVQLDDRQRLIPDLAIVVPSKKNGGVSADGRTITYHLRHGVLWHDGQPFTARDVLFTYQTIVNPKVNAANTAAYTQVQSITAPDPYTVVVRLRSPSAPAVGQLFCNGENGSILPEHVLAHSADINHDPFNVHPIGTGPMIFDRWERGARLTLRANPHYFRGAPHIKRIEILLVPDNNTRLTMLSTGELDITSIPVATLLPRLRALAGYRVVLAPSYAAVNLTFNTSRAPFDDVRVRQALTLALDRPRLTRSTYGEAGVPADSDVPPYSWAYSHDSGSLPYDPTRAGALLDAAGWRIGADGVRARAGRRLQFSLLTYAGASQRTVLAQQIQSEWRAVGAAVDLQPVPVNVLFAPGSNYNTGRYDVSLDGFVYDPDPDRTANFASTFLPPRGFNGSRINDRELDRLLQGGLAIYDRAQRRPYYDALQRRLNWLMPEVPITWPETIYVISRRLSNFRPEPVNSDFWNVYQWQM